MNSNAGTQVSGFNIQVIDKSLSRSIGIKSFPLTNIDTMRENILAHQASTIFEIDENSLSPYSECLRHDQGNDILNAHESQVGLMLKTYQSDLYNNWIRTDWIEGELGINQLTAVSTSEGYFTLDQLQLAKKMYDMLNRIAISGGSYYDWVEAVYGQNAYGMTETPMYMGGLSKEIIFSEVVSTAASTDNPLGTLAGRGTMASKHKGGKIHIS